MAPAGGAIQRFYVPGPTVDGVPVLREEWRAWTGREWVPLMSDEGQEHVFGIKPAWRAPPAPPIPKRQRRME